MSRGPGMGLTGSILDHLDQVGDWGLLATDADLVVTRWNRWLEQRSGRAAADVVGRPLFEALPELAARRMERYYRQALTGQTVLLSQRLHKYVVPLPAPADAPGFTHQQQTARIVPLVEGAAVCGTLTLIEDVTERVAYEGEMRARARQQAAVATAARAALAGRDPADLAREAVGLLHETLDADFVEVLRPAGGAWETVAAGGWPARPAAPVPAAVRHALAQGHAGTVAPLPADLLAADPHLAAHRVGGGLVAPVPGRDGPVAVFAAYTRGPRRFSPGEFHFAQALADVLGVAAERKRLEDELRLRVRDLADADRRKDEFLAMLAHELRNPLAPVRTGLEVLRLKGGADPEVARQVEMMGRQVGQISRLVDDLLDVARITRGTVTLRRERVELGAVVRLAVESARPLVEARRHTLAVAAADDPLYIDGDPARLAQVVGNLLNNAAKYTDEGGRVWLDVRRDGAAAVVSVRDTGVGIAPDVLPRVFDLFAQADRTLDRSQGGLGIGLTLVRQLVELHGGTVAAASAGPGRGSEFVVRLPLAAGGGADVPRAARPAPVVATPVPRRILVVDDNADAADSLAMLLGLSGHAVWTAYGGASALEAAERHRPDVVLLDIGLPGMDGYEVARRLRAGSAAGATLVALTGYGQDADRLKTREAGFDHHLVKPVDPDDLGRLLAGA